MRLLFLFLVALLVSCQPRQQEPLVIGVASNMQFVMTELLQEFEKENDLRVRSVVSSSGKLTAQIQEGAPIDVFLSANIEYPERLKASGLTENEVKIYAYGKLFLWSSQTINSLEELTGDGIEKIAIANPKVAPYGKAAEEALQHYKINAGSKLVYGESIAQTNQFISTGVVQAGFTSASMRLHPAFQNGFWLEVNPDSYSEIGQAVVIIKQSPNKEKAHQFIQFLFSEKAAEILRKYGYLVPDE